MKAKKGLAIIATLSLLGLSVACESDESNRYDEGFAAGKTEGYDEGYDDGYSDGYTDGDAAGYERAAAYFASADYLTGFNDGMAEGELLGYSNGYSVGRVDGNAEGQVFGYNDGYDDGYSDGSYSGSYNAYTNGYNDGYTDGNNDGYTLGYDDGSYDGYDVGYDVGFTDGYDVGFDDGYYGLSVGKTKKLQGYANIISMVHNDLFEYSKIKVPRETKRGLVANGKLLFSETSLTNKDTLKRAAIVEQYLVVEMAKQVMTIGLSAERSFKVAKAANHFRKFSSKRALTPEDTNAYATEIMGSDFSSLSKAYENSMKGDLSTFSAVIEKAAEKNEISPEKMAEIVTKNFI